MAGQEKRACPVPHCQWRSHESGNALLQHKKIYLASVPGKKDCHAHAQALLCHTFTKRRSKPEDNSATPGSQLAENNTDIHKGNAD